MKPAVDPIDAIVGEEDETKDSELMVALRAKHSHSDSPGNTKDEPSVTVGVKTFV
jgi:hypothetical protein